MECQLACKSSARRLTKRRFCASPIVTSRKRTGIRESRRWRIDDRGSQPSILDPRLSTCYIMKYETVIGLEVHAQLLTQSKIFCGCSTEFGREPNQNACPVCAGFPGVLPVLNKKVVDLAIKAGLATHCQIARSSVLARKNYFYPDLPKGYQISQYELPICSGGYIDVELDGTAKKVRLTRIHMEEDA